MHEIVKGKAEIFGSLLSVIERHSGGKGSKKLQNLCGPGGNAKGVSRSKNDGQVEQVLFSPSSRPQTAV